MLFREYLRARKGFMVLGIILAVGLALAGTFRFHGHVDFSDYDSDPGAIVNTVHLADGSLQKTIDIPSKREHVIIISQGAHEHITVIEPEKAVDKARPDVAVASVTEHVANGMRTTTLDWNPLNNLVANLCTAMFFGFIFATVLSGALAAQNVSHLPLVWTQPVSRSVSTLKILAVDVAAILALQLVTFLCTIAGAALFTPLAVQWTPVTTVTLALTLCAPIAWYMMVTGISTWQRRSVGLTIGLAWPVAGIVAVVAQAQSNFPPMQAFVALARLVNAINPLKYASIDSSGIFLASEWPHVFILLALICGYALLALFTWSRLEA